MQDSLTINDLLACPRCDGGLEPVAAGGFGCKGCQVEFPDLNGLPFLFAEPGGAMGEWQARVHHEMRRLERRVQTLEQELGDDKLPDATVRRLGGMRDACRDQVKQLQSLLATLLANSQAAAREIYLALRTRLPTDQGLNTYYQNIHRDWCWGDAENQAALDIVRSLLPEAPGRVLVLGAGAGRLSYDLHQATGAEITVALDFNPLLLGVAERVSRGEQVELWEFPIAPKDAASQAIKQSLRADPARPGLHFILGDVLRAPLAAGSFDTVITPWLIDILPVPLPDFAPRVNRLLKDGGRWVNFGSLAFSQPSEAMNPGPEEAIGVIQTTGFEVADQREDQIPYMCSPASRHGRLEQVFSFAAVKKSDSGKQQRHYALPDWLVTGREAVPALQDFQLQAAQTRIFAYVMGLIDGKRSIADMAAMLESQRLMEKQEAEAVIRDFLIRMYDDSRRGSS